LEGTGEVRWVRVSERTGDVADPDFAILQHPLRRRAAGPLDDVRIGEACAAEPALQRPDARRHLLGDETDPCATAASGEQRGDDLLDALPDVASGRAGFGCGCPIGPHGRLEVSPSSSMMVAKRPFHCRFRVARLAT